MRIEEALLLGAITGYAVGGAAGLFAAFFDRPALRASGTWAVRAAWLAHGGAIVARWVATGHAPVQGAYENSLLGAWFLPMLFELAARNYPPIARARPGVIAATLLILGNGVMAPSDLAPLEPPYRSWWLGVHVLFAWLAFGSYVVAAALAAHQLWVGRGGRSSERLASLDESAGRLVAVGFLAHTVMITSGAIWANSLWGRYWAWDPIETWSLVSWLVYAVYLHLRYTLGWQGRRAAWLGVAAALAIVITFFGVGVVSNVHTQLL